MRVDVVSSVQEAGNFNFLHRTAIVIDVLRATSTMTTALDNGCTQIIPAATVREACSLKKSDDLLGGERHCKKVAGFHLGNSPLEYLGPEIKGKTVILTTTNGTRAIQKSLKAAYILVGSMLNAASCAQAALALHKDVVLVCAGTRGEFSLEDGLCAGLIISELTNKSDRRLIVNDFGYAMLHAYRCRRLKVPETILQCTNGKKLSNLGFKEDVLFCSRVNHFSTVPIMQEQSLRPFSSSKIWSPSYN